MPGFTWILYLVFLLYVMPSHRASRLTDILPPGLLAGHHTDLGILTTTNDVCRGRGQSGEKRNPDWVVSPMRVKERILWLIIFAYFFSLIFNPPTFIILFHPLCTAPHKWGWQQIPVVRSSAWCLLASAYREISASTWPQPRAAEPSPLLLDGRGVFWGSCSIDKGWRRSRQRKEEWKGEERAGEEKGGEERWFGGRTIFFSLSCIEI